jgi:hypothetical protein
MFYPHGRAAVGTLLLLAIYFGLVHLRKFALIYLPRSHLDETANRSPQTLDYVTPGRTISSAAS